MNINNHYCQKKISMVLKLISNRVFINPTHGKDISLGKEGVIIHKYSAGHVPQGLTGQ